MFLHKSYSIDASLPELLLKPLTSYERTYGLSRGQCLDARPQGTDRSRLEARQSEIFKGFPRKAFKSNVLQVFDICLELPSDLEKKLSLYLTNFPTLCITKITAFELLRILLARHATVRNYQRIRMEFLIQTSWFRSWTIF